MVACTVGTSKLMIQTTFVVYLYNDQGLESAFTTIAKT